MSERLDRFDNAFSSWVGFGDGIPAGDIRVTMMGTTPECQDHPSLSTIREELVKSAQKRIAEKAKERGGDLRPVFDGLLPRLDSVRAGKGHAEIQVGETSYFRYIVETVSRPLSPEFWRLTDDSWEEVTPNDRANPIGIALAVVIDEGRYILIGLPLKQTDENFLLKAVPSGWGDAEVDKDERGVYRPEMTVLREMTEETGINPDELQNLKLRGRPFEKLLDKLSFTLVFTAEAPRLTRAEIMRREKEESDKLLFIPYTREAIRQAVLCYLMTSQGHMQGMLITLAKDKFGDEESEYLKTRLKRRGEIYFECLRDDQRASIKAKQEARLSPERIGNTIFEL